jgi:hypothetical protein
MSVVSSIVISAVVTPYGNATVHNAKKLIEALMDKGIADSYGGLALDSYGFKKDVAYLVNESDDLNECCYPGSPELGQVVFYFFLMDEGNVDRSWNDVVILVDRFEIAMSKMLYDIADSQSTGMGTARHPYTIKIGIDKS